MPSASYEADLVIQAFDMRWARALRIKSVATATASIFTGVRLLRLKKARCVASEFNRVGGPKVYGLVPWP